MTFLKIVGFILIGIVGFIAIFIVFIKLMGYLGDKGAEKKGKKYCEERGYTFKKVEAFPNHYGLYFIKDKMHFYASFDYTKNRTIAWKKGSPEQKIQDRINKKELKRKEKLAATKA